VDNSILEGIILQNKVGSPLARDLIIYKLLELNNVDSAEFLNKAPIEKIIDSLKLSNCINRKDIFICSRINNKIALSLIPLRIDDTIEGYLKLEKSLIFNDEVNKKILKTIIITVLIVFLLNAFTLIIIWWMFLRPETMKLIRVFETETQDSGIEIKEFRIIQDGFLSAISRVKSSESEKALMVSELEKISLASQVAHDIRSPLEMLKGIKEDLALLPQDSRRRIMLGINRIEEISFNLLRANKDDLILNNETISQELLSLVLSVITEKKIEFKKNEKVDIFDKFSSNSYGLFSNLPRSGLVYVVILG
jgi:signal transduction histidine kinase